MRPSPTTFTTSAAAALRPAAARPRLLPRGLAVAAALAAAFAVAGCGGAPEAPPPRQEVEAVQPGSFKIAWRVNVDTARYGTVDSLHLRGDSVYAYTGEKVVQRITAGGGRTQFVEGVVRPQDVLYPPVLLKALGRAGSLEQVLCFPTAWGFAVYSEAGQILRETRLGASLTTPAAVTEDGFLLVGAADDNGGRLLKVDPLRTSGNIVERVLLDGALAGQPASYSARAFVADLAGNVYGMTPDLKQAWKDRAFLTETGRPVNASVAVDDFGVYAAGTDGTLYVLSRERGRILFRYFAGQSLFSEPVPVGDWVYQSVRGRGVVALNKYEGSTNSREPAWVAEDAYAFLSHDDRRVYLLQRDGRIAAHDKRSGEKLYVSERRDFARFARNVDGPRIFAATRSGEVVGIDPVNARGQVGELAMVAP